MSQRLGTQGYRSLGLGEDSKVVRLDLGRRPGFERGELPTKPLVRIHLLGLMQATTYLGESVLPRGRKARAVLGCLCLLPGQRIPRGRLAAMLWDRVPEDQARASLRQAWRELTSTMGPLASELLSVDRETIGFNVGLCWIDVLAMLAPEPSPSSAPRSKLAGLCPGELLEDLDGVSTSFDQWLMCERTRFTERLRALLEAELHNMQQPGAAASDQASVARRLIAFDPTHEGASRALMRALVHLGERAQALREYSRCRDALRKTLDVEPSPETHATYEAVRAYSHRRQHDDIFFEPRTGTRSGQPSAPIRTRIRVGVLPFLASRSKHEERLSLSLSQEIAAALARFRWFDVICPISLVGTPSGRPMAERLRDHPELDYVVDGSLTGHGENFRISVRLLDLKRCATPVWSERFKLAVGELHQLDELVTARIVGQIDPIILYIEGQPARRRRYGATGVLLLAIPLMFSMERKKYEEAGRLIDHALETEPDNAMISAWAAYWQVFYVGQGWASDGQQALKTAQEHALRAIRIDPGNAEALGIYAHICSFLEKDFESAVYYFDRSLRYNPNLAFIWGLSAATYSYIGQPDAALFRLEKYRKLAPFDPYSYIFEPVHILAYIEKGDYEEAVAIGRRAVRIAPRFSNSYKPLIAALGHLGRHDEAKIFIEQLLALEPSFTIQRFGQNYPMKDPDIRERYLTGLRLAGVPEA